MDNAEDVLIAADKLLHIGEGWFCRKCGNVVERDAYNPNLIVCLSECTVILEGALLPRHWITTTTYHVYNEKVMAERYGEPIDPSECAPDFSI